MDSMRVRVWRAVVSAGLAAASCAVTPPLHASGWLPMAVVITASNCNDHGPGSLRNAIVVAASGDTVDLTHLSCTRITLTSGALQVPQTTLTVKGRDHGAPAIDGRNASQVFHHTGSGFLRLIGMSVVNGFFSSPSATGGCIHSDGNVLLSHAWVHDCDARGEGGIEPSSAGGGVFAIGAVWLTRSRVYANTADGSDSEGGGIFAFGDLHLDHALVSGNRAVGGSGGGAISQGLYAQYSEISGNTASRYGGLSANGQISVRRTTIAKNSASDIYGGAFLGADSGESIEVVDSTISGNTAEVASGLVMAGALADSKLVANSTIAFNHESTTTSSQCAGALSLGGRLHLQSTIVANNNCNGTPRDIGGSAAFGDVLDGADNLIGSSDLAVPPGTLSANPQLGALANNGGPTRTHALLSGSPAINTGNNSLGLAYDQRGAGHPRVVGPRADIGAFER